MEPATHEPFRVRDYIGPTLAVTGTLVFFMFVIPVIIATAPLLVLPIAAALTIIAVSPWKRATPAPASTHPRSPSADTAPALPWNADGVLIQADGGMPRR